MENCHFLKAETGAVTVDWVVLTAGLVGLGLATMAVVSTGVQDTSGDIDEQLRSDDIIRTSFLTSPTYLLAYSNDYLEAKSGADICLSGGGPDAFVTCDPSDTYWEIRASATDGTRLYNYHPESGGDSFWVDEHGNMLDGAPEAGPDYCPGMCVVVEEEEVLVAIEEPVPEVVAVDPGN